MQRLVDAAGETVAVHQRLDRDTSGVVLFGLAAEANAGLARAFAGRDAEKTYLALTVRPSALPPRELALDAPLAAGGPARRPVRVGGDGALPAHTRVTVREVLGDALLVEARPRTGRKHQVRAHLAHAGLPVLGDAVYGAAGTAPRLMLHASRLALAHPVTGRPLVIDCPLPSDFARFLEGLRSAASSMTSRPRARSSSSCHGPTRVGFSRAEARAARNSRRGHSVAPKLARCGV